MRTRRRGMHQRGVIYVMALGIILSVTIASATLLMRGLSETALSERSRSQLVALHLADAAVDQAAINLRTPSDVTDDVTSGTLPTGTFTIDAPPTAVGSLQWRVNTHGSSARDPALPRHIEAVFQLTPTSLFQFALFGDQNVNISGNAVTNSYDSRLGPYDERVNVGHRGDVGTNATARGGVAVNGSIFVDGQVKVGPNVANPLSVVSGYDAAFITGGTSPPSDDQDVVSQPQTFPMSPVSVPQGLTCNDLEIHGRRTVTLSSTGGPLGNGTYCFDDLDVRGGSQLTADGPVKMYLTGDLRLGGNSSSGSSSSVGVAGDPTKLIILIASTGAQLEGSVTGSAKFYGAVYGPQATLTISGNAEVFGSIIAKVVNLTGSAVIHRDDALASRTDFSNQSRTTLVSWREIKP